MPSEIMFVSIKQTAASVILLVASPCGAVAQKASPWLLPNFSDRLELRVSNPSDQAIETVAVVSVVEAARVAPRFPGTLAIAVLPGSTMAVMPSQADDLDGDGVPDEFVFPVKLAAHRSITVHIYYSTSLHDTIPWPRRVFASHSFGYNRATAALESEAIGYRTYGGFFLDVQARREGHSGLYNSLVGYLGMQASNPSPAGRDIFHIGDTLGLGGLFLKAQNDVYRPPLNTPDYAHQPAPAESPVYRVIADGPVRAVVEASINRWTIGSDAVSVDAVYSIAAGTEDVECRFRVQPLSLSRSYDVGAGIRHLPKMQTDQARGRLAVAGEQDPAIGPLGLALYFDPQTASSSGTLVTPEADNDVVLFHARLEPGRVVVGRYWVAADWSGSGIHHLLGHLREIERQARAAVVVDQFGHAATPAPARLEGEVY